MSNIWVKNIVRFLLVMAFQLFVLNEVELHGFINPYLFIVIILLLPLNISRAGLILASFVVGLTIDAYSNMLGMHAAACTFLGFVRPYILRFTQPRNGYEDIVEPNDSQLNLSWFLLYAAVGISLHHIVYFFIEAGNFNMPLLTLTRIGANIIISLMLVTIYRMLFVVKKS